MIHIIANDDISGQCYRTLQNSTFIRPAWLVKKSVSLPKIISGCEPVFVACKPDTVELRTTISGFLLI